MAKKTETTHKHVELAAFTDNELKHELYRRTQLGRLAMAKLNAAKRQINKLRADIALHDRLYYVEAKPRISDAAYDELMQELIQLESQHPELVTDFSPTQKVGGEPLKAFTTVAHTVPMLSLENVFNREDLSKWVKSVYDAAGDVSGARPIFLCEPKVDGVAVSLTYQGGELVRGATRGNGKEGDDITANIRTIRCIPLELTANVDVEIRGEVYMPRDEFERQNELRDHNGDEPFANPRNAAAGTLKLLNPAEVRLRKLAFLAHGFIDPAFDDYFDGAEQFKQMGIPWCPYWACASFPAIQKQLEDFDHFRRHFKFDVDGMVIKVTPMGLRETLGNRTKSPRWAIAYKYEPERAKTRVLGITVQVGKGGKLTPVAELEPVTVSGSTITRATLHNPDEIKRLDIRIGDMVRVQKAAEVIPQIVRVLDEFPNANGNDAPRYKMPKTCPSCGSKAVREADCADLRCSNTRWRCPAQMKAWLLWWGSRDAMDIDGLGEKLVDQLFEQKLVTCPYDLYNLKPGDVAKLDRMGNRSAQKLIGAILKSMQPALERFLVALAIPNASQGTAERLAKHLKSLEAIRTATMAVLLSVPDVGPVVARSIHDFFNVDMDNAAMISAMRVDGIWPKDVEEPMTKGPQPLAGKTVVITGTLPKRSRSEAERDLKSLGATVSGSVSKKTDFLLVGADAGSKLDKATGLGIALKDEAWLDGLVGYA